MTYLIFIIITIIFWGFAQVFIKKGLDFLTPWQSYATDCLLAFFIFVPYCLYRGFNFSGLNLPSVIFLIFLGFVIGVYYYVVEKGPISVIGPVLSASPVVTLILSSFFLHESLTFTQLSGVILTILGIIILSLPEKVKGAKSSWIFIAFFVALGLGIEGTGAKYVISQVGDSSYLLLVLIFQSLTVFAWYLKNRPENIIPKVPKKYFLPTILGVGLWNAGTVTFALSMKYGLSSIVSALTNAYIIIILVFSVIYLKEKLRVIQLFAVFIILAGMTLTQLPGDPLKHLTGRNLSPVKTAENTGNNLKLIISPSPVIAGEKALVTAVYDGDTILLWDKRKVRYIGIDTPELAFNNKTASACFATEAANLNTQLVKNQTVTLVKDVSETDKYGRVLRYIYLDGVFINDFLLRQGYARLDTVPPDIKYARQFKDAESEAKSNKRGLWKKCT